MTDARNKSNYRPTADYKSIEDEEPAAPLPEPIIQAGNILGRENAIIFSNEKVPAVRIPQTIYQHCGGDSSDIDHQKNQEYIEPSGRRQRSARDRKEIAGKWGKDIFNE